MNAEKWLKINAVSLKGKTVAITGSTGGLGRELCGHLASLGAHLILLDRNAKRSGEHKNELIGKYCGVKVDTLRVDLEDMRTVIAATEQLVARGVDIFIHNAGAYSIPRHLCDTGYENVFQINFVSPYYMIRELLPTLRQRGGRIIAVGSIAHNYSKTDVNDIDFRTRKAASRVYGNAKRYLMFSLFELFSSERDVKLSIVHPGITPTNITAHYPKLIYALIKYPMRLIFMRPKKAALSVLAGVFVDCGDLEWIGPRVLDVWGLPTLKKLRTCAEKERKQIKTIAQEVYISLKSD